MAIISTRSRQDRNGRSIGDIVSMGALSEAGLGLAAVVLAIIGLAGIISSTMASIATIVVGAALMLEGAELAAESGLIAGGRNRSGAVPVPAVTLDFLVGGTGIVLGILSLVGSLTAQAMLLIPAALIVFGAAMLLGGASNAATLGSAPEADMPQQSSVLMAQQAKASAGGAQILVGVAAIVLGILAFFVVPATLVLVGLIAVGASVLLTGAADSAISEMANASAGASETRTTTTVARGPME